MSRTEVDPQRELLRPLQVDPEIDARIFPGQGATIKLLHSIDQDGEVGTADPRLLIRRTTAGIDPGDSDQGAISLFDRKGQMAAGMDADS